MPTNHPDRVAGTEYGRETVVRRLQQIGCDVYGSDELIVTVPSWRPDLAFPNDLAEEVIRLEGYENLPSTLPRLPSGRGLTDSPCCAAGSGARWPGPDTSRRPATRSSARRSSTSSAWTRTTPAAVRSRSPTRSTTPSPICAPRCCPACWAPCGATSAGAATTWRSSRPGWSSSPRATPWCRPGCRSTGVPPRRSWPNSRPHCPTSPGGSASCSPERASRPAGGARATPRPGPTRSRRPVWWPVRPGSS